MKYKLINKTTGEEHLCDKVVVDGWDYYVSDELPSIGDKSVLQTKELGQMILTHFEECESDYKGKKVIATNNPKIRNINVVDEVNLEFIIKNNIHPSRKEEDPTLWYSIECAIKEGYNKSQETHPFSEEDMIDFAIFYEKNQGKSLEYWGKDLFKIWKEQRTKTLYYE